MGGNILLVFEATLANSGQIWSQAAPDRMIWFWWGADFEKEVYEFTGRAMQERVGLRALLDILVSRVRSTEGNYNRVPHSADKIVDMNKLEKQATYLASQSDNEEDSAVALRFLEALKRRN